MSTAMKHAGRAWWTPLRILLAVTAVTFALGMVQKSGCYRDTWEDGNARYVQMCYSDLPYLYTGRGLAELAWPYSDDPITRDRYETMEYPVGIAYWAWGAAWVTHWISGSPDMAERHAAPADQLWGMPKVHREITRYVVVNAIGFGVLALASIWFLVIAAGRRPWHAAAFAASPVLLFTGLINWDMLAVACVAGALAAWARGKPVLAGIAIGLGTAMKLYPMFLLGGILVLCLRRRDFGAAFMAVNAAVLTWIVVNGPAVLTGAAQWKVFWRFNAERVADLGSLWLAFQQITGHTFTPHTINVWSWILFGAWCVGVLILGLLAKRQPTLAELGFVLVAGFLIVNKVYSPQYVLWLLPLAVLARPKLIDQAWWQAAEFFYFASVWWYLGGFLAPGGGTDVPFYWLSIFVRVAGELWLVWRVIASWRKVEVRRAGEPVSADVRVTT